MEDTFFTQLRNDRGDFKVGDFVERIGPKHGLYETGSCDFVIKVGYDKDFQGFVCLENQPQKRHDFKNIKLKDREKIIIDNYPIY